MPGITLPATIRLSEYRTLTISIESPATNKAGARMRLETYITNVDQLKVFEFGVPFSELRSFISALSNVQSMAIEKGWLVDSDDQESANQGDAS
jgi:hypothetical protein